MRVWVDLTNSPHALFFAPIVRAMTARGDEVLVTARRFAHTVELAERHFDHLQVIGSGEATALSRKALSLQDRVRRLIPVVRAFGPDVAVAHGSYDQPITARLLRVPSLAMVDYEYHPGTHLLFRLASRLLLPEAFSERLVAAHGGRGKTWRYRGLKEEVYLASFRPDPQQRITLGIDGHAGRVVTVRPPAVGAMYHRNENPLWDKLVPRLQASADTLTLILPRHPSQVADLTGTFAADNVRVMDHAVDGPALVWWSDAVISAGGTMNREAVALGTPVWSMFSGRLGAVDRSLIAAGRMHQLTSAGDLNRLRIPVKQHDGHPNAGHDVLGQVVRAIERTAALGPAGGTER